MPPPTNIEYSDFSYLTDNIGPFVLALCFSCCYFKLMRLFHANAYNNTFQCKKYRIMSSKFIFNDSSNCPRSEESSVALNIMQLYRVPLHNNNGQWLASSPSLGNELQIILFKLTLAYFHLIRSKSKKIKNSICKHRGVDTR